MCNKFNVIALILLPAVFVACHKQQGESRIPPYQDQEKPTENYSFPLPKSFPDRDKVIGLLMQYVRYKEAYKFDSLAYLYAPIVEQYDDIYDLSGIDVAYYTRKKIEESGLGGKDMDIKWGSVFIDSLSSTRARISFYGSDNYGNRLNASNVYFIFKQLEINDEYLIVSEKTKKFHYDHMCDFWRYDYSPVDENEELHDNEQTPPDDYIPCRIHVPCGTTIQEAVYKAMPHLREHEKSIGVGGAKALGEMSADKDGIYTSKPNHDIDIDLRPQGDLNVRKNDDPESLYEKVCSGELIIIVCRIGPSRPDREGNTRIIYLDPPPSDDVFGTVITVKNPTENNVGATIPEGTVIEAVDNDVQNIVTTRPEYISVPPHQTKTISIPSVCAAKKRKDPVGSKARITPYMLTSENYANYTQDAVWEHQSEPKINRLVFYVYGTGIRPDGHKSYTGHAFAYVPGIGYTGFGTHELKSKNRLFHYIELAAGTDGSVFDHKHLLKSATDSCVIYISNSQLKNVQNLLEQYIAFTPPYRLGRYDCTTFVKRIADAADIYYGTYKSVQTPVFFMKQLKKYNQYKNI